jgi:hypothetical protein
MSAGRFSPLGSGTWSIFLIVAQEAVQFYWRDAPEFFLKAEVNFPAIVRLLALLRRPANGVHELGEFSRFERPLLGSVGMSARLVVGRHWSNLWLLIAKQTTGLRRECGRPPTG